MRKCLRLLPLCGRLHLGFYGTGRRTVCSLLRELEAEIPKAQTDSRKAKLEMLELRGWYRRPSVWQSWAAIVIGVVTALVGMANGWFSTKLDRLKIEEDTVSRQITDLKAGKNDLNTQIAALKKERDSLSAALSALRTETKRELRAAAVRGNEPGAA